MRSSNVDRSPLSQEFITGSAFPEIDAIAGRTKSSFAIHRDVANALARLVVQERRTRILEFGAGTSSLVFAHAMARIGGGMLTSIEQMPQWCAELWTEVERLPDVDARLIESGLRPTLDSRGPYYQYSLAPDVVRSRAPFDLVFIDAPESLKYGRDGPMHWSIEHLAPGALVVLDDARRRREQRSVRRWLRTYPGLELACTRFDVGRGLTVLRFDGDRRSRVAAPVLTSGTYDYLRMMLARVRGRPAR